MKKRYLLIINPVSGILPKGALPDLVRKSLGDGVHVEVVTTEGPGDATLLARHGVEKGYDAVLVAGGDGTVNEVATGMVNSGIPMGILPCGSGNGLARHLSIPLEIADSLKIVAEGHYDDCDYGTADGRPFFCTFGMGFDAAVSEKFAGSKRRGLFTYLRDTFLEFHRYRPRRYLLECQGRKWEEEALLVAVCNASQYGNNAYIAPQASIVDGQLDVTVIRKGSLFRMLKVGADLMAGKLDENRRILTFRTDRLLISRPEAEASHLDGDPVVMPARVEVVCHPGRLRIFTPEKTEPFVPIKTPARSFFKDMGYYARHILQLHRR